MAASLPALSLGNASVRQLDGLFSLNDLHAAAGGSAKDRPANFLRRQETQALIAQFSDSSTALRVVNGGDLPGTYACRELVIAYAAWISAAFHLRVIRVFLAQATAAPARHPMAYKRVLVDFDHTGHPGVSRILSDDARVFSCGDMAAAVRSPGAGGWSAAQLLDLAEAIHTHLAEEARRRAALVARQQGSEA